MRSEVVARFLRLRAQKHEIEDELARIRPTVVSLVDEMGGRVECGEVAVVSRIARTWRYSEKLQAVSELLKAKRRQEVSSGVAILASEAAYPIVVPVRSFEPWTSKEEGQLIEEFGRRLGVVEIAKRHWRSFGAIQARLDRLDLSYSEADEEEAEVGEDDEGEDQEIGEDEGEEADDEERLTRRGSLRLRGRAGTLRGWRLVLR